MPPKLFEEQIFFSTVRIITSSTDGRGASIGTGFLYKAMIDENSQCVLLISNRHVYGDGKNPIQLVFNRVDPNNRDQPLFGETIVLDWKKLNSIFSIHPDSSVDLACLNVSTIGKSPHSIFFVALDDSGLADFSDEDLLPGNEVWFIGYPENRFDTKNNLPILRKGCIASMPKIDFEGRSAFLIDAQVFPGSSGSPVFTRLGNGFKFRFIGVVTETMIKNERVQSVPTIQQLGVTQILGLGIVLKANLVDELIETAIAEIKERRAKGKNVPTTKPPQ